MSAEMETLAARVEALAGPDRAVDCLIWCATAESHFEYHGGECVLAVQGGFAARLDWKELPHPTASLDAAMTLVPDDPWIEIKGPRKYLNIPTTVPNIWSANVSQWNHEGQAMGWGATPALALTAACLRAIALRARPTTTGESGL